MKKLYDVSVAVSPKIPVWPNTQVVEFNQTLSLDNGDIVTDTIIKMSVHTGTHIDAPSHFLVSGSTVEQVPLDILVGETYVAVLDHVSAITAECLEGLALPSETCRLLLKTQNSELWRNDSSDFDDNFVALTFDAAQWVVDQGIKLIGIDYLSIQRYNDGPETHQILLGANVVVVEGLDLSEVPEGSYELICLPVKFKGLEGAPSRVILREL